MNETNSISDIPFRYFVKTNPLHEIEPNSTNNHSFNLQSFDNNKKVEINDDIDDTTTITNNKTQTKIGNNANILSQINKSVTSYEKIQSKESLIISPSETQNIINNITAPVHERGPIKGTIWNSSNHFVKYVYFYCNYTMKQYNNKSIYGCDLFQYFVGKLKVKSI